MRVGFVGLGSMGTAMVGRLLETGVQVAVWNRTPERAAAIIEQGARLVDTVSDLFDADIVLSMLANDSAVEQTFSDDVLARVPQGRIHVNMATVSVACAAAVAARHEAAGVGYLAAPVLGRPPVAAAGQLTILAAGAEGLLERAEPVLAVLGKRTWRFGGKPDQANLVKIGMNYMLIHALQGIAESMTLVETAGVDPAEFIELATSSFFPGPVYSTYGGLMARREYLPPAFTTELGLKDVTLARTAAQAQGVDLPFADGLTGIFEAALATGLAESDWASIAEVTRSRVRPAAAVST
jgi:3-hydroxyisobutyrate dehydrogenase-like beta-hydroxyacid dehydrogenase